MKIENKTPIAEEIIRNNPTGHGLFAGIGDNFNSVAQVICELMDDAVSNLRANKNDPELSMTDHTPNDQQSIIKHRHDNSGQKGMKKKEQFLCDFLTHTPYLNSLPRSDSVRSVRLPCSE